MTISTIRCERRAHGAFTLVEVVIASTIAGIVMAAVMTSFLMLGRSGVNIAAYSRMESQARRSLEEFAQDLRMASAVTWNSSTSITLTVPNNYAATGNQVTYAYDSATMGPTAQCFYRRPGGAASTQAKTVLIENVVTFAFSRFDRLDNIAAQDTSTKRIQVTMTARTQTRTVADATNNILSASYILRNKPVN